MLQESTNRQAFSLSLSIVKGKRIVLVVEHSRRSRNIYDYYIMGICMFGGCKL